MPDISHFSWVGLLNVGKPEGNGEFKSDTTYRQAVLDFEKNQGRCPIEKRGNQSGHDIDSFTHPEGHPDRKLIRRIEVKGKGVPWNKDQIVEMSDTQCKDALELRTEDQILSENFDYWLYVVEEAEDSKVNVLPLRNPARRAARYELRGGTWRHFAERRDITEGASEENSSTKCLNGYVCCPLHNSPRDLPHVASVWV